MDTPGYIKFRALRICFGDFGVFFGTSMGFFVDEKHEKHHKVSCLTQWRPHVVLLLLLSHFWHGSGRSVSAVRSDGKSFHPANCGHPQIGTSARTKRFWDRKSKFRSTVNSKICIISTIQPFSPWPILRALRCLVPQRPQSSLRARITGSTGRVDKATSKSFRVQMPRVEHQFLGAVLGEPPCGRQMVIDPMGVLYIHCTDSLLKGGMTIPNRRSLDLSTYLFLGDKILAI